jgi:hypothetical protein
MPGVVGESRAGIAVQPNRHNNEGETSPEYCERESNPK